MNETENVHNKTLSQTQGVKVSQHNILINTPFRLGILENRIYTLMLTTIDSMNDVDFKETFIPLKQIISYNASKAAYNAIEAACDKLHTLRLNLKSVEDPDVIFDKLHVFSRMKLIKGKGIIGWFDPQIKPYLLQLKGNFTSSQIEELLNLKSPHAHKMYWLLNSYNSKYQAYGRQPEVLTVEQIRELLLEDVGKYKKYGEFKKFILSPAYEELKGTQLEFEYDELKTGKVISHIKFRFSSKSKSKSGTKLLPAPLTQTSLSFDQTLKEPNKEEPIKASSKKNLSHDKVSDNAIRIMRDKYEFSDADIDYFINQLPAVTITRANKWLQENQASLNISNKSDWFKSHLNNKITNKGK
ncbi:replication initiation protein [Rufibacter sp. XAAS-G3-1]|uniref:replication initiation protein n=1 Tax=Rufibacter sp. XAAS-G3-1 TaxID=2729134 RepID=UPI0015E70A5C|nr:replication initiation protein [Rufibacter sp. XAAS-G3-1]